MSDSEILGQDLALTPLAHVLITALKLKVTGELSLQHTAGEDHIYFEAGLPSGTQTYLAFKPLGRLLVELGWITTQQLEAAMALMEQGKRQGEALVELGALRPQQLTEGLRLLQTRNLVEMAKLTEGHLSFDASKPSPSWAAGVPISPLYTLREVLAVERSRSVCESILQKLMVDGTKAEIPEHLLAASAHFEFDADETAAIDLFAQPVALVDFFSQTQLSPSRALALAAELALTGLLLPAEAEPEEILPPPPLPSLADEPTAASREDARARRRRLLERGMANMGGRAGTRPAPRPLPSVLPPLESAASSPSLSAEDEKLRQLIEDRHGQLSQLDVFGKLGLSSTASPEQIKQAFVQAAKIFHPDHLPASLAALAPKQREIFSAIKDAYDLLSHEDKRREAAAAKENAPPSRAREEEARKAARKGEELLRQRDYVSAAEAFRQAFELVPNGDYLAAEAWSILSDSARKSDRRAREQLLAAAEKYPKAPRPPYFLGVIARMDGQPEEAEKWLRKAIALNPRQVEASQELHLLQMRKKRQSS